MNKKRLVLLSTMFFVSLAVEFAPMTTKTILAAETEVSSTEDIFIEQIIDALEQALPVSADQTVIVDDVLEFTIEQAYITEEILPSNIQGSINYMEDKEDSSYIVFQGNIKNNSNEKINFGTFNFGGSNTVVTFFFIGDTCYYGNWVTEDSDGSSITATIESGDSAPFYIFSAIPDGEITDIQEVDGVLTVFKDMKETIRNTFSGSIDWDSCTQKYYISLHE